MTILKFSGWNFWKFSPTICKHYKIKTKFNIWFIIISEVLFLKITNYFLSLHSDEKWISENYKNTVKKHFWISHSVMLLNVFRPFIIPYYNFIIKVDVKIFLWTDLIPMSFFFNYIFLSELDCELDLHFL